MKGGGGSRGLVGCCLCHQIPKSVSLSASWFAGSVGSILAWIQPNQHFGLSPAVTKPRLWLSMPQPHQMLEYLCLCWPSTCGFPGSGEACSSTG